MQVEARDLTRRFGSVTALDGVGFTIPCGRRVALVGPNGSGKSTLNRVLMGLLRFEGAVSVGGFSPLEDRLDVSRRIAYVPQIAPNLGVPVFELVRALGGLRGVAPADVAKPALRLGLDLEAVARRPLRGLSGGMKQKLLLALALAAPAALLILDEPTGSLDAWSRDRFFELFAERSAGATVILCSHRLEEVRQLVDHVLLLDEGRLVYDGRVDEFLDSAARSVIEVRVEGAAAEAWLAGRGFRRGAGGWWLRNATPPEKRALISEIGRSLGASLRDLNARDLEALEIGGSGAPPGGSLGRDADRG